MATAPTQPRARRVTRARLVTATAAIIVAGAGFLALLARSSTTVAFPRLPTLGALRDVYDGDFGDPFLLTVRSGSTPSAPAVYELFGTDDWPAHIPTAQSTDLTNWQHGADALPNLPAWANPDPTNSLTWAPTLLATANGYLMYVSVQERASRRECIAAVFAVAPQGPYRDALGAPMVCQRDLGGSIDPSLTRDDQGHLHLVWKSDGNCCDLPATIWTQDLAADGLRLTGIAHRLLSADAPWQGGIIENPALLQAAGGGWWLFYSGNRFDLPAYATGLAYCPTLTGPCRETSDRPFLAGTFPASTGTQYAPGGLDFFRDAHGTLWAVLATWNRPPRNGRFYCCRSLDIAPVLHV